MAYTVLLVGKTGHGKSSTGNTILKREAFDTFNTVQSGSQLPELKSSKYNNYTLNVFDVPGLCDAGLNEKDDKKKARENIDLVFRETQSLHAILLVYRYNNRFTREERKTIEILKEFFGEKFLKKNGIIVVTYGDLLEVPKGETEEDCFMKWCSRQNTNFKQLVNEVDNRILLVANKGDFSEGSKRFYSSKRILEMVVNLQSQNEVYTKEEYEALKPKCSIL